MLQRAKRKKNSTPVMAKLARVPTMKRAATNIRLPLPVWPLPVWLFPAVLVSSMLDTGCLFPVSGIGLAITLALGRGNSLPLSMAHRIHYRDEETSHYQQDAADHYRGIGHIEGGPAFKAKETVEFEGQEVDDPFWSEDAVDYVAQAAADDTADRPALEA